MSMRILILLVVFASTALAQGPDIQWTRTFTGSDYVEATCVQETSDDGFIVGGYIYLENESWPHSWVIKLDHNGDTTWTQMFSGNGLACCFAIIESSDGSGYLLAGFTRLSESEYADFWIGKVSLNGDSLWTRTFGGYYEDICENAIQVSDGGYLLVGETCSFPPSDPETPNVWVIKINENGESLWNRIYWGGYSYGYAVQETDDSGFIIAGSTAGLFVGQRADFWAIKTDSQGDTMWTNHYGGSEFDYAYTVLQTSDRGYLFGGYAGSYGQGLNDFWVVKTDENGHYVWDRTYGGTDWDELYSMQQTYDGGYILAGFTNSYGAGNSDFWLVKINEGGDTLWTATYGGNACDRARCVKQTSDGGYILAGYSRSHGAERNDFWVIKTEPENQLADCPCLYPQGFSLAQNYPNPFNASTRIEFVAPRTNQMTLTVYDITGRIVARPVDGLIPAGQHFITFDASRTPSGVYIYHMQAGSFSESKKMILVK